MDEQRADAGEFSSWLAGMQAALRGERGSDVPCDGCTACCTSSQFIHIGPDEIDTIAHIPAELLFPAPRLPRGHVLMGYDERGHCPMLIDGACSIYEHRPMTCRTYDCRVFPAAGVELDDDDKALIARRASRWRFTFPTRRIVTSTMPYVPRPVSSATTVTSMAGGPTASAHAACRAAPSKFTMSSCATVQAAIPTRSESS